MQLTSSFQLLAQQELGNVYGSKKAYIRLYGRVSSSGPDIANNQTKIYLEARLYSEETWFSGNTTYYRITGSGGLDTGNVSCPTTASSMWSKGEVTLGSISGNIGHYDDGTRDIHGEVQFVSTPWGWNVTASVSDVSLPTIPRASSVSCSSPYIGDTATITIGKKSSGFSSTVTYKIGTLTGTIADKTTETVLSLETEILKEQIYALIPNAKSTSGIITCTTYSGNTQIGSPTTANFNLYAVEEDCKPIVTGEVVDTNPDTIDLTGDSSIIVKNASKPKVTVTATPRLSSTIKSYSINLNDGQTASEQEYTFDTINSNKITANATDSRGYSNSYDIDLTDRVIDYVKLHFNSVELTRPEGTSNEVILDCDGVWFNGDFSEETPNTLIINFQYRLSGETEWIDGGEITPTIDGNKFSFNNYSLGNLFDYNSEYQFKIIATDLLMTVGDTNKEAISVPKGQEVWFECEDGIGVYGHIWLNDKLLNKNIMTIKGKESVTINFDTSYGNYQTIPFTDILCQVGNGLVFENNGIRINCDATVIKVSGTVNCDVPAGGNFQLIMIKNGEYVAINDSGMGTTSYSSMINNNIVPRVIPCEKGDFIQLIGAFSKTGDMLIRLERSVLTVEVIE